LSLDRTLTSIPVQAAFRPHPPTTHLGQLWWRYRITKGSFGSLCFSLAGDLAWRVFWAITCTVSIAPAPMLIHAGITQLLFASKYNPLNSSTRTSKTRWTKSPTRWRHCWWRTNIKV